MVPKRPAAVVHAGTPPASSTFYNTKNPPDGNVNLTSYGSFATGRLGVLKEISVELITVVELALYCVLSNPINFTTAPVWKFVPLAVITVFSAIFPMAIGGSIIIEMIFSIPGMGLEIYNSLLNYDYPMIITVFTLSGFLTMVGYLVADLLYAVVDPRISYK